MNKKQIRLTESDLKQIVKESVSKLLKEAYEDAFNDDFYNRIRPIQDGINAVNIEVTNKFRLNEYELTIRGSIQNNEIIFQLDNTAIIAGVDESFPCDWDEFQIITKHIYNHFEHHDNDIFLHLHQYIPDIFYNIHCHSYIGIFRDLYI